MIELTVEFFEIAKPHIESSLEKGYEKLDNANLLVQARKYSGAIPIYVGSYEEIGQSLFLLEEISNNKNLTKASLNELFKPANHNQKILNSYIARRNNFQKNSVEDFEKIKNSKIGHDFHNPYNIDKTIKRINERITLLSKLHKLRQVFDYSHNKTGQITNNNFNDDELDSFCFYLKSECLTSYYETKLNLEGQHLKFEGYSDDELSKIRSLSTYKKFQELSRELNLKNNKKRREEGLKFLKYF